MPDYSNTTGRTWGNASGSVRIDNNIFTIRKVKPAKTSRADEHAYAFGKKQPQAIVAGREEIENGSLAVGLVEWNLFITANPNWKDQFFQISAAYTEETLGSFTFNHKQAKIVAEEPSEGDGATTGEALMSLEFKPLAVNHAGKSGSARV